MLMFPVSYQCKILKLEAIIMFRWEVTVPKSLFNFGCQIKLMKFLSKSFD